MSRLQAIEPQSFHPSVQEALGQGALSNAQGLGLLRVLAQRPDLTTAFLDFRSALGAAARLPARLVELVRLRVAFHNQCRSCMALRSSSAAADGVTEDLVCSLATPEEADDRMFDRLREQFTEPEIVELGVHLAVFVGFGRLSATWDLVDDLPERFHDRTAPVTPWGAADAVVAEHR